MTTAGALDGHRIVPVVVIDDPARAADLAHALAAGGIHCAEITLRTSNAVEAIRAMAEVPGFVVGAGTVVNLEQASAVLDAGAQFIVSPGFSAAIVDATRTRGAGVLPGIATGTEAMTALQAGLDVVKFFPADRLGGLATIRALAAPFPQLGFVPSGGVTALSAPEYLADPAVPAVSGSWMVGRDLITAGDFETITRLSRDAVAAIGAP
ncbi:MAG: bifunctional 4-hydroxy-2-oxoglutarate aldolase/2-dehydro-3-deoxy-phosphogluconate aldolase [Pseudolysinimonas sp.]|uniref:bifunctional 4-hydroxy-2-oxoglutarate aldolase/2-dehydro-3-deoxy-phosphogluconate aldolase n=1 Tax=Pseudolysinimonas sp. TaxID=2680009 RepID=UPI003265856B